MARSRSVASTCFVLCTLLAVAGCAPPFPPPAPGKPSTTISGSAAGSVSVAGSAAIAVYATDSKGHPLADVLVYAQPVGPGTSVAPSDQPAVLNILDRQFEPAVLPVRKGGTVLIQNLDGVTHDIYSFSAARPMSLRLAAGERHTVSRFRRTGVVTVGCKVYNEMRGYIYVTDAPYFGKTDAHGYLRIAGLPSGRYKLGAWRAGSANDEASGYPRTLTLTAHADEVVHVRL